MIAEVNLFGLFINVGLVSAGTAALLLLGLRRFLSTAGAYGALWHPALADVALFVLLWGLVALAESVLHAPLLQVLG